MDIGRSERLGVDVSTAPSSMGVETLRLHHFLVCEVYELGDLRMPIRKGLGKNDNNEDTCHRLYRTQSSSVHPTDMHGRRTSIGWGFHTATSRSFSCVISDLRTLIIPVESMSHPLHSSSCSSSLSSIGKRQGGEWGQAAGHASQLVPNSDSLIMT